MRKRLINVSNIHSGGGLQVAVSFLALVTSDDEFWQSYDVWVSSAVFNSLLNVIEKPDVLDKFVVYNSTGMNFLFSLNQFKFFKYKVIFTLFGPVYSFFALFQSHIVGFAQSKILFDPSTYLHKNKMNLYWSERVKFFIQSLFFRMPSRLVVELEHVRDGLVSKGIAKSENIDVVYNAPSQFVTYDETITKELNSFQPVLKVGIIGADYPHKNLDILEEFLFNYSDLPYEFYVTLSDAEYNARGEFFKQNVANLGVFPPEKVAEIYNKIDVVLFPSLVECFSCVIVESMLLKKVLIASDRRFVSDIAGDYCFYFDPLDPESLYKMLNFVHLNFDNLGIDFEAAKKLAIHKFSPYERANKYLNIVNGFRG